LRLRREGRGEQGTDCPRGVCRHIGFRFNGLPMTGKAVQKKPGKCKSSVRKKNIAKRNTEAILTDQASLWKRQRDADLYTKIKLTGNRSRATAFEFSIA